MIIKVTMIDIIIKIIIIIIKCIKNFNIQFINIIWFIKIMINKFINIMINKFINLIIIKNMRIKFMKMNINIMKISSH